MTPAQPDLLPSQPLDAQGLFAAALDDIPKARWPQELVRGIEVIENVYKLAGLADDEAFRLARAAMLALADYGGGRDWYLPRGDALQTALRDAEIYRLARRDNIQQLAEAHGLTPRHVWRILSQQYKLHRAKLQLPLFPAAHD